MYHTREPDDTVPIRPQPAQHRRGEIIALAVAAIGTCMVLGAVAAAIIIYAAN